MRRIEDGEVVEVVKERKKEAKKESEASLVEK